MLDYQQLEDQKTSVLVDKTSDQYEWRTMQLFSNIVEIFSSSISLVATVIILFPQYWYISILLFIGEIPGIILDRRWQKVDWDTYNKYKEKSQPKWDIFWQLRDKRYISELKIYKATEWLKSKFIKSQEEYRNDLVTNRIKKYFPDLLAMIFSFTISVFCSYLIVRDISVGILSIGMFSFYFNIIRNTGDYFASFMYRLVEINEHIMHINNLKAIVDLPRVIVSGKKKFPQIKPPAIEFRNVSFKYPDTDKYIFKNLSFSICPEDEIALVGANGAGKSTLIKLICRFYDPTDGQILVNGEDLKNINLSQWYNHISLLSQEYNTY